MLRRRRVLGASALVLAIAVAIAAVACGSSDSASTPPAVPSPTPTLPTAAVLSTPVASGSPAAPSALDAFTSFHYTVRFEFGLAGETGITAYDVTGDYTKPDRHAFTSRSVAPGLPSPDETAVVIIGPDAWVKPPGADWTKTARDAAEVQAASSISAADPVFFGQLGFGQAISTLSSEAATVGGRSARRHQLTKDQLNQISGVIGAGALTDEQLAQITDFQGTAWVDEQSGLVTRFETRLVGPSAEAESGAIARDAPGGSATIAFSLEITRIGDSAIKIEPPI